MEFSREEIKAIVILGCISGFIIAFDTVVSYNKGVIHVDYGLGIMSMLLIMFGMIVSAYIHEGAHKFFARRIGYYTHVEPYYPGQVLGIVFAFFTFGTVQFFTPNTCDLEANPQERIHKHRKYENFKQQAFISASGVLVTAIFTALLHGAWLATGSKLLFDIMMGNVWIMVYSLIPFELLNFYLLRFQRSIDQLPQSDGLYIMHYSTAAYVFATTLIVLLAAIFAFNLSIPIWVAVVISLLVGTYAWVRYFSGI
jgi:hypothetical protein